MKYKILFALGLAGLVIFSSIGTRSIVHTRQKIQIDRLELKSKSTELKTLQLKYDKLNTDLDSALKSDQNNATKIQEIEKEKDDLEKQKHQLEQEVSVKKQQSEIDATQIAYAAALPTGSHTDWMAAAGIPASDYGYVDFIVSHESGWGTTSMNSSSGAYGLCQSLPASKMASAGADYMSNPITQLRWCNSYATKYGGWAGSYAFWAASFWW